MQFYITRAFCSFSFYLNANGFMTWKCLFPFNACVLGPNRFSGRTTISSASEQVSYLYSLSFKRSGSVRALKCKRLPTELINFAHGGSRDEVSQWELNKSIQEHAMATKFLSSNRFMRPLFQIWKQRYAATIHSSLQPYNALNVIPPWLHPPRSRICWQLFFETKKMMNWTWR